MLQEVHSLKWLRSEPVDGLPELRLFAEYARPLGAGKHNIGEATVLAWAEFHQAIAFTDDEVASNLAASEASLFGEPWRLWRTV
jgi:hypothetical protein